MLTHTLRRPLVGAALALITFAHSANAEMIDKTSPHSVAETIDRLEAAVTGAGATVFARIDHSAGAVNAGLELPPSQLLVFGNPKLGTPAMQDAASAGLDLPLRVLAYQDSDGAVHVVYHDPTTLAATHGIASDAPYLQKMTGALDKLTGKAIAQD